MTKKPTDDTSSDDDWGPWPDDERVDEWEAFVDDEGEGGGGGGPGDPLERGVETLQAAARELIRAARTVLDLAEDVVDDPDAVVNLLGSFSQFARGAARSGFTEARRAADAATGRRPDDRDEDGDDFERIRVE